MKIVDSAKLAKMSLNNLIELQKRARLAVNAKSLIVDSGDVTLGDYKVYTQYANFLEDINEIIEDKQNKEKKSKTKHDHDKRAKRIGRDQKRSC